MKLSLCMIVKDEAASLPQCLASVGPVVDEMIVVDTGSTDATPDLALEAGAKVYHHAWAQDFSLARNQSLAYATGEWILVLDADEILEEPTAQALRPMLASTAYDGFRMIQRSLMPPDSLCKYQDVPITRLFRNRDAYRYQGAIHEEVQSSILATGGSVAETDLVFLHHGYAQVAVQGGQHRALRNLELLQQAVQNHPDEAYLHYHLGITYKSLGDDEQAALHLKEALQRDHEALGRVVNTTLFMKLAQLELAADRYEAAVAYADRSLTYDPANIVSLHVMALSYMFLGHVRRAYHFFECVRQSPNCNAGEKGQLDLIMQHCRSLVPQLAKV